MLDGTRADAGEGLPKPGPDEVSTMFHDRQRMEAKEVRKGGQP